MALSARYTVTPSQLAAAGEGIQARAEDDVLAEATPGARREPVLGVTAPAGHLRPGAGEYGVGAVCPVVLDELVGPLTEHGLGQGIGEDHRLMVDDQMSGARGRRHEGGDAGLSIGYHARKITIKKQQ
jgi:hypothetical protein